MIEDRPTLAMRYPTRRKEITRMAVQDPTPIKFMIKVTPTTDDPHNWRWSVTWHQHGVKRFAFGPAEGETVLSRPEDAKAHAEAYVDTMAANLVRSEHYRYEPRMITDA